MSGFSGLLFLGVLIGRTAAVEGDAPYFTNQDIERYKETSDSRGSVQGPGSGGAKKETAARLQAKREAESWCKKARTSRKRIQKDKDDVQEIEGALEDLKDTKSRKKAGLEKKLAKARKQLESSERDLAELEDDAHRNGVPPGWLRCQFD
jgi:chromosome segregation ATPase